MFEFDNNVAFACDKYIRDLDALANHKTEIPIAQVRDVLVYIREQSKNMIDARQQELNIQSATMFPHTS